MRLSGHFLPLGTIAWGLALYFLFGNLEFLGKYDGINGIPVLNLLGWHLESGRSIYYLIWAVVTWGKGQTPAQRLLGLRCWRPDTGRVADRKHMAIRQVTGLLFNGEALMGVFILFIGESLNSVGDFFAGTTVLYDPDNVLLNR